VVACLHCDEVRALCTRTHIFRAQDPSLPSPQFQTAAATCAAVTDGSLAFEHSYALYKLDQVETAAAALQCLPKERQSEEAVGHLRAQVEYRQCAYSQAAAHYEAILSDATKGGDEHAVWDAQLNLLAALVSAGHAEEALRAPLLQPAIAAVLDGSSATSGMPHEVVYNVACALLDADRPAAAASALALALASGASFLEEQGLEHAEIASELAPVRAQAAMLLQEAGYDAAANGVYASMGAGRKGEGGAAADATTLAVAVSNLAVVGRSPRDVVNGYKRICEALRSGSGTKLTSRQHLTLQFNKAALALSLRRYGEAEELVAALRTEIARSRSVEAAGSSAAGASPFLLRLTGALEALAVALDSARRVVGGDAEAGSAASLESMLQQTAVGSSASSSTLSAARAQLLLAQNSPGPAVAAFGTGHRAAAAGAAGVAGPILPAEAVTMAYLLQLSGTAEQGATVLRSCAEGWAAAARSAFPVDKAHAVSCSVQAAHAHAAMLTAVGRAGEAGPVLTLLIEQRAALGMSPAQHAGALAALATLRTAEASAAASEMERVKLGALAASLLREARALGGLPSDYTHSRSPAVLEWLLPGQSKPTGHGTATVAASTAAAPASSATKPGPAPPATPSVPTRPGQAEAKPSAPLILDPKKRRAKAKRARRRERYLIKLKASGKFELSGIPRPDPERWMPKRDRARGGKARRAVKGATGYGHQGGDAAATAGLDARAKAEREKAAAALPPVTGKPPPSPKGKGRK